MAKGDDIEARLVQFAVGIFNLCDRMPKTAAGGHIAGQLLRSGSSPAPNYGEVRGAESTKDFVHKLGIVLKELNESRIWLRVLRERQMMPEREVESLYRERDELCRIIASSRRTAEAKAQSKL